VCKNNLQGWEKTVRERSLGYSCRDGVETRRSENETRLGAGGLLQRAVAGLATVPMSGGCLLRRGLPGSVSVSMQGLSQLMEMI
jgi:hypothetical protein